MTDPPLIFSHELDPPLIFSHALEEAPSYARIELFRRRGLNPWAWRLVTSRGELLAADSGFWTRRGARRNARRRFPQTLIYAREAFG